MAAIQIDLDSPIPLEKQLAAEIRAAIARGTLAVGDALPPVRQLAADLGIHFNTVARAYRELERDGLLRSVRGRGTIITSDRTNRRLTKRDAIKQLRGALREALSLAKLHHLDRDTVEKSIESELNAFWKEASS